MKGIPPAFRMEVKYPSSKVHAPSWKFPVSPMTGASLWQGKVRCMASYSAEMSNV